MNIIYAIILYSGIYSIVGMAAFILKLEIIGGYTRVTMYYYVLTFFCVTIMVVNYLMKSNEVNSRFSFVILFIFLIPIIMIATAALLGTFQSWNT